MLLDVKSLKTDLTPLDGLFNSSAILNHNCLRPSNDRHGKKEPLQLWFTIGLVIILSDVLVIVVLVVFILVLSVVAFVVIIVGNHNCNCDLFLCLLLGKFVAL